MIEIYTSELGLWRKLMSISRKFPAGEPNVQIGGTMFDKCNIVAKIKSMDELIELLLFTDAARRLGAKQISLVIPYLPFARQDRVMNRGESLSLKVFCDIINSQNYQSVTVFDCHSDVGVALLNNCKHVKNHNFVKDALSLKSSYLLVSPDAGAYKKIYGVAEYVQYHDEIIVCGKRRSVEDGGISGVTCHVKDFQGMDLVIIDDICDGGYTFVMLSKELKKRNCGSITLIVSHGIFSKGMDVFEDIDHIITTDSFEHGKVSEKLTVLNIDKWTFI